ncbi:hypothetical protein P3612_21785 [Vibrio parahaemolyticus]|nr:hypothetical protein [Vibrio parahaemolyticus]
MSRVIKKVGDEIALLARNDDRVTNAHGEEVFEAAFNFVGELNNRKNASQQPAPKATHKSKPK